MKRLMTCMALTAALGLAAAGAAIADDKGGGSKGGSGGGSKGSPSGSTTGQMGGSSGSKNGPMGGGSGASKGGQMGGSSKPGSSQSQSNGNKGKVDTKNPSGKFDNKNSKFKDYHLDHGQKFSNGWCYRGKHHCHWSDWCWNSHWGCYNYWCPSTCRWYYWYEPACCYYPMTYIQTCTPVAFASPQAVPASAAPLINIQNSAANAGGVAANNVPGIPPPPQP